MEETAVEVMLTAPEIVIAAAIEIDAAILFVFNFIKTLLFSLLYNFKIFSHQIIKPDASVLIDY